MKSSIANVPRAVTSGRPDYLATLEVAWQDHLKPREPDAPTVISTFAGGGGSSLGYSMAGYRELLAVVWDKSAIETFHLNFPTVPFYHGDIAKLTVAECLKMAQIEPGQLYVLDGSPPCQGFSTAGKRNLDDPRNSLFKEFVRLLRGLKPKAFVMENVSGMVKGKMKLVFAEILRELKASDYKVKARLLNAMYFGVPQSRQRMIFVGIREDLEVEPSHPAAQDKPVTVREAWQGLAFLGLPLSHSASRIVARMKPGDKGKTFARQCGHEFTRLEWEKPSPTILKNFRLSGAMGMVHPFHHRHIGISEAKRLGSFPDRYCLVGTLAEQWERIGNSVPPLFMRAIALHVRGLLSHAGQGSSTPTPALSSLLSVKNGKITECG